MSSNDQQILTALERLGAQFPWDEVTIWIRRAPAGQISFTAHLPSDYERATPSAFGQGATLADACRDVVKDAGIRDPEGMRQKKLEELREQIRKLEGVTIGLPPYVPGTLLAPGALALDIEV